MFGLFRKKGIEHYERELASPSKRKRKNAARRLGKVMDPGTTVLLSNALQDVEGEVRESAAYALGQLQDSTAVRSLERALGDVEDRVCQAAGISLMELGEPSGLESLLRWSNELEDVETLAGRFSEGILHAGSKLFTRAMQESSNPEVRQLAAHVLICANPEDALVIEVLSRAYQEDDAEGVRRTANDTLGTLKAIAGQKQIAAYCFKCESIQEIESPDNGKWGYGRLVTIGDCSSCGEFIFRLGSE